jgi:uncharacterized SAM-binding protein YcdF (DUF218 family)
MMAKRRQWHDGRKAPVILAAAAVGLMGAVIAAQPVFARAGGFLTLNGSLDEYERIAALEPADIIFVLNGRVDTRAGTAMYAYSQGLAGHVLIARIDTTWRKSLPVHRWIVDWMVVEGVPRDSIEYLPGTVRNTRDEARALRSYLEGQGASRVIAITTDYHARRARLILRRELRGLPVQLQVMGGPDTRGINDDNWWKSRTGIRIYAVEYIKLLYAALGMG